MVVEVYRIALRGVGKGYSVLPTVALGGEAIPEWGARAFFRPQVHERIGISLVKIRVGKSVISVYKKAQKGCILWLHESREAILDS